MQSSLCLHTCFRRQLLEAAQVARQHAQHLLCLAGMPHNVHCRHHLSIPASRWHSISQSKLPTLQLLTPSTALLVKVAYHNHVTLQCLDWPRPLSTQKCSNRHNAHTHAACKCQACHHCMPTRMQASTGVTSVASRYTADLRPASPEAAGQALCIQYGSLIQAPLRDPAQRGRLRLHAKRHTLVLTVIGRSGACTAPIFRACNMRLHGPYQQTMQTCKVQPWAV